MKHLFLFSLLILATCLLSGCTLFDITPFDTNPNDPFSSLNDPSLTEAVLFSEDGTLNYEGEINNTSRTVDVQLDDEAVNSSSALKLKIAGVFSSSTFNSVEYPSFYNAEGFCESPYYKEVEKEDSTVKFQIMTGNTEEYDPEFQIYKEYMLNITVN